MERTDTDPEEFLTGLPEEFRADAAELDARISAAMPGAPRVLWEGVFWGGTSQQILGYGTWSYTRNKQELEWFVVGLAVQKGYISVYINGVEDGKYLVEKYADTLGKVKTGKSVVNLRSLDGVDVDALIGLVAKSAAQGPPQV